eukprot:933082-Pelagomonas_calceolata.AAC.2
MLSPHAVRQIFTCLLIGGPYAGYYKRWSSGVRQSDTGPLLSGPVLEIGSKLAGASLQLSHAAGQHSDQPLFLNASLESVVDKLQRTLVDDMELPRLKFLTGFHLRILSLERKTCFLTFVPAYEGSLAKAKGKGDTGKDYVAVPAYVGSLAKVKTVPVTKPV